MTIETINRPEIYSLISEHASTNTQINVIATISHRTLERWCWMGEGLRFLKVSVRAVYRLSEIEEYE